MTGVRNSVNATCSRKNAILAKIPNSRCRRQGFCHGSKQTKMATRLWFIPPSRSTWVYWLRRQSRLATMATWGCISRVVRFGRLGIGQCSQMTESTLTPSRSRKFIRNLSRIDAAACFGWVLMRRMLASGQIQCIVNSRSTTMCSLIWWLTRIHVCMGAQTGSCTLRNT